jgi:hypothetical protein
MKKVKKVEINGILKESRKERVKEGIEDVYRRTKVMKRR